MRRRRDVCTYFGHARDRAFDTDTLTPSIRRPPRDLGNRQAMHRRLGPGPLLFAALLLVLLGLLPGSSAATAAASRASSVGLGFLRARVGGSGALALRRLTAIAGGASASTSRRMSTPAVASTAARASAAATEPEDDPWVFDVLFTVRRHRIA